MSAVIDDYEPLEIIGNGSFGVIRKVKRRSDGQLFARKELNFERMNDRDRKQIVAEVNILKDLKHENIVRYINRYVDHETRILYILMEYCGGGDLGAIINTARRQSRPLPEDQIWNYFVQMVLALHHCHFPAARTQNDLNASPIEPTPLSAKQVLHRDLKPENVFLSTDNDIKLGDFGLSKQITSSTFASTYVGTPYYMSPELMSEKAYDTKSDIWSLGCMVYEMCALRAPFHDAQTYNELANAIRSGRIPPLPKGYSTALSSVIKSMLNINPAMRPSTQQLLKIEQLMYAKKLIDVNKMVPEIRNKHEAILAREKAATIREQAIAQREASAHDFESQLSSLEAQLQAERTNLHSQRTQLDAERSQFHSQQAQFEADVALLEKAREEVEHARADFDNQVMQAKQAYELFSAQKEAFLDEKTRWEQEVLARMTTSAPLLDDLKNKPTTLRSSRYASDDQTPTKGVELSSKLKLTDDEDTPLRNPPTRRQPTFPVPPLPALPPAAVQRLQPQHSRKPAFLNETPPAQQETPRRLTSSKSLTDLGSAMKGVILTETGTALPTPVRRDTGTSHGASLELDNAGVEAPGSSGSESQAGSERHRLPRRRSILQPSRPTMPSQPATTSLIPRVPSGSVQPQTQPELTASSTIAARAAPLWDQDDEENLPSPFVKRNVDFSAYSRTGATTATGAITSGPGRGATLPSVLANKPRTSNISKALKASGEAQKALARRQAEGKTSVS